MKYYAELMKVENSSIDLEVMASLSRVISGAVRSVTHQDIENSIIHLADQLGKINDNLRQDFNTLFETIRDDTHEIKKRRAKVKA